MCGNCERPSMVYLWSMVFVGTIVSLHSAYLGCYFDQESPRKLAGDFKDFPDSLTPQVCMNFCRNQGYPYAGLQYRSQCFCGDQRPTTSDKKPESECSLKCSGNDSQNCGGDWRNSVYESGFTDVLITDSRYIYVGCFIDQNARELGGYFVDFGNDNSPEVCINLCKAKGFAYAGLQYRTQCFCGDQDPMLGKRVDQEECKTKCPGDKRFNCGGDWRNIVYKTTNPGARSCYLGCYADQESRNLRGDFKDFPNKLTPQECMDYCKNKEYPFAGLQFSSQCFCGDEKPNVLDKRPEADCDMKCSRDESQMCGGAWRNSIYLSGFTGALLFDSRYKYIGCYADQETRELSGHFQDLGYINSPQRCIALCKKKSYMYAGLQHRTQCFCGNEEPKPEKRVDQQECKTKCPGDKRFNCGGDWRNNVYKTEQSVSSHSAYLGCYNDQSSPRKLAGDFKDFPDSLTPQVCMNFCGDKGLLYAGLQYRSQCFCGDQTPTASDKRPESECNLKCSGNDSLNCGGYWRNSVYESGFTDMLITDSRYIYVGCFIDQDARELGGYFVDFGNDNSPEVCINLCKAKGFAYAGLQYRTQCFCGDQDPTPGKRVDQQECKTKCPGDKRFNCGGDWRNIVYKTTNPGARSCYLGCYADQESRNLRGDFKANPYTLTPQECMDYCKNKGYPFAGLQFSSQCFCGNEKPNVLDKRPEADCNMKCFRDQSQICGGAWRNSIYLSGFTEALLFDSRYKYIGCYADQETRELSGHSQDLGDNNSPQRCIALCKEKSYTYAGLQHRTQCFCGNEEPKPEKRVDQQECKTKCPGDKRFNCGGDWRNNVYKTDQSGND